MTALSHLLKKYQLGAPVRAPITEFPKRATVRWTGTRAKKFKSCPALYAISEFTYRAAPINDIPHFAAAIGTAMHQAWQTYLRTKNLDLARAMLFMRYPWDHPYFEEDKRPFHRQMAALEMVCAHPYSQYPLLEVTIDGVTRPAIELAVELIVPTASMEMRYTGSIDAIVRDPVTGVPIINDLKTSGWTEDAFVVQYGYDEQVLGYAAIVSALAYNGDMSRPVRGAYIGVSTGRGEPWLRVIENEYKATDVAWFIQGLHTTATMLNVYQHTDRFPRNPGHCGAYNSTCPYFGNLCDEQSLTAIQNRIDPFAEHDHTQEFKAAVSFTFKGA